MKTLLFTAALIATFTAFTQPAEAACCALSNAEIAELLAPKARFDYSFYKKNTRKNYYTLSLQSLHVNPAVIEVLNDDGKRVYFRETMAGYLTQNMDLSRLPAGNYVLKLTSGNQEAREYFTLD